MDKDLKEVLNYIIINSATKIVDFIIYVLITILIVDNWFLAAIGSWLVAVGFAFWANRNYVFESINDAGSSAYEFFLVHLLSLVIGIILLLLLIYFYDYNIYSAKIMVNIIMYFSGYILYRLRAYCNFI